MKDEIRRQLQALAECLVQSASCVERPLNEHCSVFQSFDVPPEAVSHDLYWSYLAEHVIPRSAAVASPTCVAHMTSYVPDQVLPVAVLALLLNQNMVKRDASLALTNLERHSVAQLHKLIYELPVSFYERHAHADLNTLGIVTSGGTSSNITALWVARNRFLGPQGASAGVEEMGMTAALSARGYRRAVIIGSSHMHYSIDKAAGLLGLGTDNCLKIRADSEGRVDVARLRETVETCRSEGFAIVAIVGVAGTTDSGSIDPLDDLADVAAEAGVHFHVDAAWGAPFLFSPRYASLLEGIQRADSVTVDGHKQMHLPLTSSMVLLRDPAMARSIEKCTRYMLHPSSGDLGARSLEGSRPCSALHLHAGLHLIGRGGYAKWVDESIDRAKFMAGRIKMEPSFELLVEPQTNIVLYRYIPSQYRFQVKRGALTSEQNDHINILNECIQRARVDSSEFLVSRTTISREYGGVVLPVTALRAVLSNPLTTESDIAALLNDNHALGEEFVHPPDIVGAGAL